IGNDACVNSHPGALGAPHRQDCRECTRLWREYAQRTTDHIHLLGKHRLAKLRYERDAEAVLDAKLAAAELEYTGVRHIIVARELPSKGNQEWVAFEEVPGPDPEQAPMFTATAELARWRIAPTNR